MWKKLSTIKQRYIFCRLLKNVINIVETLKKINIGCYRTLNWNPHLNPSFWVTSKMTWPTDVCRLLWRYNLLSRLLRISSHKMKNIWNPKVCSYPNFEVDNLSADVCLDVIISNFNCEESRCQIVFTVSWYIEVFYCKNSCLVYNLYGSKGKKTFCSSNYFLSNDFHPFRRIIFLYPYDK